MTSWPSAAKVDAAKALIQERTAEVADRAKHAALLAALPSPYPRLPASSSQWPSASDR
jgi:hypothetical protein